MDEIFPYICIVEHLNNNEMIQHDEKRIGDYLIKTYYDESPDDPRSWDNFGKMICFHKKYNLGDKHDYKSENYSGWEDLRKEIESDYNVGVILPLYLYDHSGTTMSTSPFDCRWDSGQVGWIFCTKEDMDSNWIELSGQEKEERCEVLLKGEVETYDQYLIGDVYGYKVFKVSTCNFGHEHEEELESCWGIYGDEECMTEGESVVKYLRIQDIKGWIKKEEPKQLTDLEIAIKLEEIERDDENLIGLS